MSHAVLTWTSSAGGGDFRPLNEVPTPYLLTNLGQVESRYRNLLAAVPGLTVFYAMKCNPAPEILRLLGSHGAGYEVASLGELRVLQELGVDPAGVLYSNPVKPPAHIAGAWAAGLWRFSVDAPNELVKIAQLAPGAAVYVRLRVDDRGSVVPLSRKFGANPDDAYELMLMARRLGLRPYGLTFHVGSQCTDARAWPAAIAAAGVVMARLRTEGIELEMLDLGGGFPARYITDVPPIEQIGAAIIDGLGALPYRPPLVAAEPGRFLVAEAGVLAARVIGREQRDGTNWLFVEVGAYHGLGEVLPTPGGWRYPMRTSVDGGSRQVPFTVTGPSCDSTDTFAEGVLLPDAIGVGDVVDIGAAGAYTLSYATSFNGFPPPVQIFTDGDSDGGR